MPSDPDQRSPFFIALYSAFLLEFVATPLWNWFPGQAEKCALVAAISFSGLIWAYWAAERWQPGRPPWAGSGGWTAAAAAIAVLALNFTAVQSGLPWRGDEDFHLRFTWALAQWLPHLFPIVGLMAAVWIWSWLRPWPLRSRRTLAASLLLAVGVFLLARRLHFDYYPALRYPYFLRYLSAPPVALAARLGHTFPPPEFLFRLIPMLAAAAMVWVTIPTSSRSRLLPIGFVVYLASIPLLWYYSSILYLELPAAFLLTVVCLHAEELLADANAFSRAWPALLFIGFIKETTLPFLLAFVLCRAATGLRPNDRRLAWIIRQSRTAYCALWPLLLYLLFRFHLGNPRHYVFHPQHLLLPLLWKTDAFSWLQQFGVLLLFAAVGAFLLLRRRRFPTVVFLSLTLAGPVLVHLLDTEDYVGLGRFNLLLLPGLLALSRETFALLLRKPGWAAAALTAAIAVNFCMTPIHLDGSKVPRWGNYLCDEGEHYYSYRAAFRWIDANAPGQDLKITGLDYPYWTAFYHPAVRRLFVDSMPRPCDESRALDSILLVSRPQGFGLILFQVRGKNLPAWQSEVYAETTFANEAQALMLFVAKP